MLAALLALLTAIAAATALLLLARHATPETLTREELVEEVAELQAGLRRAADGTLRLDLPAEVGNVYDAMPRDAAFWITDATGRTVASSRPGPALQALMGLPMGATDMTVANPAGTITLQVIEAPMTHAGRDYTARIARSDRLVSTLKNHATKLYLRAGLAVGALALLTFAAVIYLTVRCMLRPLHQVSRAATQVGPRRLGMRLRSEHLPSEVVPLIDAFNAALARLEQGYRVQQEFLAAAAHELKTPLALLQAEIELSGAPNTPLLLRDTAQMARQVHQLLHLAEVSEGHNYTFAPVHLGTVIADTVDYLSRLAKQHAVAVVVQVADPAETEVEADASAVFVLVKNLLENAIHHSPRGSTVHIQVNHLGFSVRDAGPGVDAAHRPLLFKRFWRGAPKESEGAGLGLAICMEICLSHGWEIVLTPPDQDAGACFVVSIARELSRAAS
ncbi:ATP-binding protein [Stenotrophomonas sp.]|uniref:sensor histidine kinase n=1 Tax=Stenotrophomonas sp. TaxID=69392 RepID=UPI0028A00939|nr:ATP-binding protein [Stenotrophomonas sp.]